MLSASFNVIWLLGFENYYWLLRYIFLTLIIELAIGCAIYGFMSGITGTTSIMSLAAIAFDRYRVISNPLQINKKPTRAGAYRTVALIWIYSSVFASLPFFGVGKYIPEGYLTSCSFDYLSEDRTTRTFILVFFVAAWVVPCVIIAVCYSAIVWYVREARKEFGREQFAISVAKNCSSGKESILLGKLLIYQSTWI